MNHLINLSLKYPSIILKILWCSTSLIRWMYAYSNWLITFFLFFEFTQYSPWISISLSFLFVFINNLYLFFFFDKLRSIEGPSVEYLIIFIDILDSIFKLMYLCFVALNHACRVFIIFWYSIRIFLLWRIRVNHLY